MSSKTILTHQPCPACPSSDAYCVYDDGHGFCYSCNTFFPGKDGFNSLNDDGYTYEYLPFRGMCKEALRKYDILTKIDKEGKPLSVGMVWPNGAVQVRMLGSKEMFWVKNSQDEAGVGLFGRDKFSQGGHKYVTITEGAYDAVSLYQELSGGPVVSVVSSGSAARDVSVDYEWVNSFERIYLAFDGDIKGREAAAAVAKLFDYNKVYLVKFTKHKDANDYLQAGEQDDLKKIWWNARKYQPEYLRSTLTEFEEAIKVKPKVGIPYPFKTLTDMTYGIRTGECVLITAEEKVGKTSILHAIEYNILRETDANVGALYYEESLERHLQSLAGIHLKTPLHLPDHRASESDVVSAIRQVVGRDDRLHVYSHSGGADPGVLPETIRFLAGARGCRYFFVDPIGVAVSEMAGEKDERRALDSLCTKLALMAKELDIAIFITSHVNDDGKTRSSRWLTKIFDITIQASRNHLAEDPAERNTINLQIPFNRFCAKSGPAGRLRLDPKTYLLTEEVGDVSRFGRLDDGGELGIPPKGANDNGVAWRNAV